MVSAEAETLDEAMASAYLKNPTLLAERASVRSVDEGVSAALSNWRPTIQLSSDAGFSNIENTSASTGLVNEGTIQPRSITLNVTESVYRGGRTVAQTHSAENQVRAARAQLAIIEQSILLGVVKAYMEVLTSHAEVQLNNSNEEVVAHQLDAAKRRYEFGVSTRTDVAQAEARLAQAYADRIVAVGNLTSARAGYRSIIGDFPADLYWPSPAANIPFTEEDALQLALQANPAILSARYLVRAAHYDIRVATGGLLPEISVRSSYGLKYDPSISTEETKDFTVKAALTIPIYQSGKEYSDIRRAKQAAEQQRLALEEAHRATEEEVSRAWEELVTTRVQITAFEAQVRATEIALEGVEQEAMVGLRTTLDVLDAEQELFEARVNLVRARRDEIITSYRLKAAVGELLAGQLALPIALYDTDTYYQNIRNSWLGISIE